MTSRRRSASPAAGGADDGAEALTVLAGCLAHDVNNILGAVIGALEVAAPRVADPVAQRMLDVARTAAGQGALLARRLAAFARRETQAREPVDIARAVAQTAAIARRSLGGITLVVDLADRLGAVSCGPGELENALLNLILNARDAVLALGPDRDPSRAAIRIVARRATAPAGDAMAEIEIADRGCGMSAAVRARATEPFFSTKPGRVGAGLGLSAVSAFVRSAGGALSLDAVEGEGAVVRLRLPLLPVSAEARAAPVALILVAEPQQRSRIAALAAAQGFVATPAASIRAAGAAVAEAARLDLLVLDLERFRRSAAAFTASARRRHPGLGVILLRDAAGARPRRLRGRSVVLDRRCDGADFIAAIARARAGAGPARLPADRAPLG